MGLYTNLQYLIEISAVIFRHLKSDVADVYRCSNTAYMKIVHEDADMMLTMYICEDHIYIYIYPIWCHLFIC